MHTTDASPSTQIRRALIAKGYGIEVRVYGESQPEERRSFTYFYRGDAPASLLLEVVTDAANHEELTCDLWQLIAPSGDLAGTLAAIP